MEDKTSVSNTPSRWVYFRGVTFKVVVGVVFLALFGLCVGAAQDRYGGWGILLAFVAFPIFFFGCLSAHSAWRDWRACAVIRSSLLTANSAFTSGDRVAVSGVIKTAGVPLQSPFSRAECTAYSYRVSGTVEHYRDGDRRSAMQNSMLGFHMLETQLESPGMTLKLMALPEAEPELNEVAIGGDWGEKARAWLDGRDGEGTTAEPDAFAAQFSARETATFPLAQDFLISRVENASSSLTVEEEFLPVGEEMCLLGCYEALDQGLSGRRTSDGRSGLIYYRGSADTVMARLGADIRKSILMGLCMIVVGGAASFWPFLANG